MSSASKQSYLPSKISLHQSAAGKNVFMITLLITYSGNQTDRFDRGYYVNKHLPMARYLWKSYGLLSIEAFFPASGGSGTVAACHIGFRDEEAMKAAYAAPGIERLLIDSVIFTDLPPIWSCAIPMDDTE